MKNPNKTFKEVEEIVNSTCEDYFAVMTFMYSDKIPAESKEFWEREFNTLNARICMLIELGMTDWKEVYSFAVRGCTKQVEFP